MYTAVSRQFIQLNEHLKVGADVTAVGSLICVYAAVTRQMTGPRERLTADVTAYGFSFVCIRR